MADESPTRTKYSSILSTESRQHLSELKVRKSSAASTVSASSDVSDFLDYKIKDAALDIDYTEKYKQGVVEACYNKKITKDELSAALKEIKKDGEKKKKEYVAIKRQRKLIQDDMEESRTKDLEKAYAAAMTNRVRIPPQLNKVAHNSKKRTKTISVGPWSGTMVLQVQLTAKSLFFVWCPEIGTYPLT